MRQLYIDHSVIACGAAWPFLEKAISTGRYQLVLSPWNLFEIGAAKDLAQRRRRLSFLEELKPLWLLERTSIQRQEIERFLWRHHFACTPKDLVTITPSFTMVHSFMYGPRVRIGITPSQFIDETDYDMLNPLKKLSPDAQRAWRQFDAKTRAGKKDEVLQKWVRILLPVRDPAGTPFSEPELDSMAQFCIRHRLQFLTECPTMAVEDVLTAVRNNPPFRRISESDGPDLQHTVPALAYCDVFLTLDKDQARCAEATRAALSSFRLAEIYREPAALLN